MKRLALTAILLSLSPAVSWAQGFADTTTGRIEESKESYGLSEDRALTARGKRILQQFKKGRESSAKNTDSRYSGTLEFHDANQDGIVDHKVDDKGGGLEGRITSLLPDSGRPLIERAAKSREEADKKHCPTVSGVRDPNCFNPSGIIVDTGASHTDGPHRKLKVSEDASKIAGEVGKEYGEAAIRDIEKIMQKEYGLESDMKVAAIDELRSEAAWLEEQKGAIYERSWKSLRAARLAGYDSAESIQGDTDRDPGAVLMHDIDAKVQAGASDREIAESIHYEAEANDTPLFVETASGSGTYQPATPDQLNPPGGAPRPLLFNLAQVRAAGGTDAQQLKDFHNHALDKVSAYLASDPATQDKLDRIANCMNKDVWCVNQNAADDINGRSSSSTATASLEKYDELPAGMDPGDAFKDTRELINMKMAEAQNAPIDQIEGIVRSLDFNEDTDPEYFRELKKLQTNTKQMQQDAEANGVTDYNTATQSVREFSGIRVGINDTFKEENTEPDPLPGAAGNVLPNRPPASVGPTYNLSPQPGSGGPSSPN